MKTLFVALLQFIIINLVSFSGGTEPRRYYAEESPFGFLNDNRSVRAAGMGNAFVAVADDGSAVHINSAGIGQVNRRHFLIFRPIDAELRRGGLLGYIQPLQSDSSLGGSAVFSQRDGGGRNLLFTASYARLIEDSDGNEFFLGLSAKGFSRRLGADKSDGLCFDIGVLNRPVWASIALGASIQNIGPRVQFKGQNEKLPLNIRVGTAYFSQLANQPFIVSTEVRKASNSQLQFALGTEIPINHLIVRAGYNSHVGGGKRELSLGAGIHQKGAALDYVLLRDLETGVIEHQISLSAYIENRQTPHVTDAKTENTAVASKPEGTAPQSLNTSNTSGKTDFVKILVNPNTISPNNDGLYDEAIISVQKKHHRANIAISGWKLGIYETVNQAKSFLIKSFAGMGDVPRALYWNGQNRFEQRAKDGVYYVQLFLITQEGHPATKQAVVHLLSNRETIVVDTKGPESDVQAKPPVFYISPGEPDKTTFTAKLLRSDMVQDWILSIYDENGKVVKQFNSSRNEVERRSGFSGSARKKNWDWDGVGDNGNHLGEGKYIYVLTLIDSVANSSSTPPRVVEIKTFTPVRQVQKTSQSDDEGFPEFQVNCFPSTFIPWSITSITPEDDDAIDAHTTFTVKSTKVNVGKTKNWRSHLVIYDSSGKPVMDFPINQLSVKTKWDGRDKSGSLLPLGNYTFLVESIGRKGQKISTPPQIVSIRERENIIDKIVISSDVMFDFANARIKPVAYDALKHAANAIRAHPNSEVRIEGHTCDMGSDVYNIKLSTERAASVYEYLVKEENIPKDRLSVMGYGESRPIVPNDSEENRQKNRRVEIIITTNE